MQNSYLARLDLTASAARLLLFARRHAIVFLLLAGVGVILPEGFAQSGTVQWTFPTAGSVYSSPAIGSDGTIYFGSLDHKVYAVKPNGSNRWEFAVGAEVWGSPALGADDTVYIGSQDGKLHAIRSNGLLLWEFSAGNAISSTPAVGADGSLYVTSTDGKLYALDAAGVKKWEYVVGAEIRSSPAIDTDGTIYFGARDKKLHAVNPDGSLKWEFLAGGDVEASPSIGPGGVIYVGSTDGKLYAVSRAGAKLWEFVTSKGLYSSAAVGVDGSVYVGGYDTGFYAVLPTGQGRWVTPLGNWVAYSSAALAADGTLYVGTAGGRFFALSSTGTTNWVVTAGADFTYSSPAIASDGTVYVGSDDGKLYAIRGAAGPAAGAWPMFHRDARRSGDGFVDRVLPPSYSPGEEMTVTLRASPPAGVGFYVVEDSPPANWQVGDISDDGYFDSANRRVRFGPFSDGLPRLLSYTVTPPQGETGTKQFVGISSANGADRLLGGDHLLSLVPSHPADRSPVDNWLTVGELTAYGAAWKRGTAWPAAPGLIPSSYLNRAIALWQAGEFYGFDTNFATAPAWWVSASNGTNLPPSPLPAGTLAGNGTAAADMPFSATPGAKFRVTITVTPSTNVSAYAVEDQPPAGWEVSDVGADGQFDRARWKVKWGPYFDHLARTNSYWVSASLTPTNRGVFAGVAAFDGSQGQITGQREVRLDGGLLPSTVVTRMLPAAYSPGMKMLVSLQVVPLTNHLFYVAEDLPPAGWVVGQVSNDGTVGSASRNVRFGPFFDGQARVLTYELTPPLTETGVEWFSGTFSVDGVQGITGGDSSLDLVPVHPADAKPIDAWLTIREMTSYGAAWKRGTNWQAGPNPIPAAYVSQAIALWRNGEGYRYDTNAGDGPYWWVSTVTGADPPAPYPDPPSPGSIAPNGQVTAEMPVTTPPGRSFTVTLSALPSTNGVVYAFEDQPPPGWVVGQVSDGGFYDAARRKVKWGPFFDHVPRDVSYSVQVPSDAAGVATFAGTGAFDAAQGAVGGARQVVVTSGGTLYSFVSRILPPGYLPGARSVVTLQASPPSGVGFYIVEDVPPPGWAVSQIDQDGVYDGGSGTIKFGPFFDDVARTLTYQVTPPAAESGVRVFDGVSLADDAEGVVAGDAALSPGVLHPADIDPVDSWLTIDEMTAYGAAWKRGAIWPLTSDPVPTTYLTRAMALWAGGEHYGLDPAVTNAPRWWINVTNSPARGPIPVGILPGSSSTNGTAQVDLPRLFRQGVAFAVTIMVTPGTNVAVYAVEDHPPEGWLVSQVSQGGFYDAWRQKVKWGPFFDSASRTLSYQVTPSVGAGSVVSFYGGASFDGDTSEFVGRRRTFLEGSDAALPRFSGLAWTADAGAELTFHGVAGEVYGLDLSTNLIDWVPMGYVTNVTSLLKYSDAAATNSPMRFYRAFWK